MTGGYITRVLPTQENLSADADEWVFFRVDLSSFGHLADIVNSGSVLQKPLLGGRGPVIRGATLNVVMHGGTGDADLYVMPGMTRPSKKHFNPEYRYLFPVDRFVSR